MVDFEVKGILYRASKLEAFAQGNLARRLGPLVPKSVPAIKAFAEMKAKADAGAAMDIGAVLDSLDSISPLADALAALSDDAFKQIMVLSLSVVSRQQGNSWASVMRGETLMFSDIEFGEMLPMMIQVIRLNLGNFTAGLLSTQSATTESDPPKAG